MEGLLESVVLSSPADKTQTEATVVRLTRELAKTHVDAQWWVLPGVSKTRRQEEWDHSWKWSDAIGEIRQDRWHEFAAIQTTDGQVQGAILYRFNALSFQFPDTPAVYVQNLATAPRNRPGLVNQPKYRGVGTGLLLLAVCQSYSLGFQGRVNLLSRDHQEVRQFYERRRFQIIGYDDELIKMELSAEAAQNWLSDEGLLT